MLPFAGANEHKFYFQNDRNRHKYKQIVRWVGKGGNDLFDPD